MVYSVLNKILSVISNLPDTIRYRFYISKYDINKSFRFNGKDILFYGNGVINTGKNSYIGRGSTIQSAENFKVIIGDDCSISHNVRIYTSSKLPDFDSNGKRPEFSKSIIINNSVWIGANVFINPGVEIGEGAVIGANAVVTKNIEAFSINGGVPSKLIRMVKINV